MQQKKINFLYNTILSLSVFPLLFTLFIFNLDKLNIIYISIFFIYLISTILFIIYSKKYNFKNKILKNELLYTSKLIILLLLFIIIWIWIYYYLLKLEYSLITIYWRLTYIYFSLSLLASPILVYVKNNLFREYIIFSRKVLWILTFIFFLKHSFFYFDFQYLYFTQTDIKWTFINHLFNNIISNNNLVFWLLAGFLLILPWITSNKISLQILWKKWKKIQRFVYPAYLFVILHIILATWFDILYISLFLIVFFIRTFNYFYKNVEIEDKNNKKTTKYICIPCWFIYDEKKWDPDSWIAPWTKFEDIPDNWICPICWVKKSDFEPYLNDEKSLIIKTKIYKKNMLTQNVMELKLKLEQNLKILKWQYAILIFEDWEWEFIRYYSIVEYKNKIITFWIKLDESWRWADILKNLKIWNNLKIKWINWEFILRNTNKQKVFIATWTWISPILNMVSEPLKSKNNFLFFWVQKEKDLFYLDKILNRNDLSVEIFISREETSKYNNWRINLDKYKFNENAEFYICWNPTFVNTIKEYLTSKGYNNIITERY